MKTDIKASILGIIILGIVLGLIYAEHRGYKRCETEMQAKEYKTAVAYAEALRKAQEERDEKQAIIDRLMSHAASVRIHVPTCASTTTKDQNGTTGLLSQRVDESFARLQERTGQLLKRCDELNLDAVRANSVKY